MSFAWIHRKDSGPLPIAITCGKELAGNAFKGDRGLETKPGTVWPRKAGTKTITLNCRASGTIPTQSPIEI
jgi:hypothetical protein